MVWDYTKDVPRNLAGHVVAVLMFGLCSLLGAMALSVAVRSIIDGSFQPETFAATLLVGVVFGGTGLGALYLLYGHQHLYPLWQRWQFERYAEAPWKRRKVWRTGRIPYRKPSMALFLWIFALGWNACVATVLVGNRDMVSAQARENWLSVLPVGLFPLAGAAVLYAAIRSTFARRYSKRALFVMASVPAWTGGKLEGTIETRIPPALKNVVELKLSSSTGVPMRREIPAEALSQGRKGLAIPVEFDIEESAAPTDELDPASKNIWTLEARMIIPNEKFLATFQIPVYRKG